MGRSPCCDKSGLKKGPWTPDEDAKLVQYIQTHGPGNWRALPKNAGLERCGKSCRLRWSNYLRPGIKRGRFSFEEEEAIIQLHSVLGNKWSTIAARLPGRTDNEIKNYWNTHIRKRLLKIGIDPVTHAPRLDQLDLSSLLGTPPAFNLLSNLLRLQSLLSPLEAIGLATSLASSQNENGRLFDPAHHQPQAHHPGPLQPNHFGNITTQPIQTASNLANPSFLDTSPFMQGFPTGPADPIFQDNLLTSGVAPISDHQSLLGLCFSDMVGGESSKNSSGGNNVGPGLGFDSVFSTPDACSPAARLNLESDFINGGKEDESESFCSDLLRFEMTEGLGFDELITGDFGCII